MRKHVLCSISAAVLLFFSSCGGSSLPVNSVSELELSEALAQINALPAPAASDAADFASLKRALCAELAGSGVQKWSSAAPSGSQNIVDDLVLSKLDDFTAQASWSYLNVGDYDQNRQTNISDLTPLGANLGRAMTDEGWLAAQVADGDLNGEVNISDITPLGANLQSSLDGYFIESTTTPEVEASWLPAGLAMFEDSTLPGGGGRRQFSATVPATIGQHFRVVPFSGLERGIVGQPFEYTGQTTGGPELSFEQREEVFDAVAEKMQNFTATTSEGQDAELAELLGGFPQIEDSGFEEGNAWGRFIDGRLLIVCKNLAPSGSAAASAVQDRTPASVGIPVSKKALLVNTFGPGELFGHPEPEIAAILNDHGYSAQVSTGGVDVLKTQVKDLGILYIYGHGGRGVKRGLQFTYGIWSGEPVSKANETKYEEELDAGDLAYSLGTDSNDNVVAQYMFTSSFISKHMSFSDNSFVFLSACKSLTDQPFVNALFAKKATVCFGWISNTMSGYTCNAAKHLFDRCLGANVLSRSENPDIRPFPYVSTIADMYMRGVSAEGEIVYPQLPPEPTVYSNLGFLVADDPTKGFVILAPTIEYMMVDETQSELQLFGEFGDKQGKVFIDDVEAADVVWDEGFITCALEPFGAGSRGDVYVEVDSHKSNVRQLSAWRGDITLTTTDYGSLTHSTVFRLHLRGDVGEYREFPSDQPLKLPGHGTVLLIPVSDSYATVASSGSHTVEDITVTWSDAAITLLPVPPTGTLPPDRMVCSGFADLNADVVILNLQAAGSFHRKVEDEDEILEDADVSFGASYGQLELQLGPNYEIIGDSVSGIDGQTEFNVSWEGMELLDPPRFTEAK